MWLIDVGGGRYKSIIGCVGNTIPHTVVSFNSVVFIWSREMMGTDEGKCDKECEKNVFQRIAQMKEKRFAQ